MARKLTDDELTKCIGRLDGWQNLINQVGSACDPASAWTHTSNPRLTQRFLDELYRSDGMAARISDLIVDDAFRCGWKLVYPEDAGVDPGKVNEINTKLGTWHKQMRFIPRAKQHKKQARVFGGSLLVLGLDDGQNAFEPLDPKRLRSLNFAQPIDRFQTSTFGHRVTDATSPWYGFPELYRLQSTFGAAGSRNIFGVQNGLDKAEVHENPLSNVTIHTSRVWRSDGVLLTERSRIENEDWGDSIYERLLEGLKGWNSAMANSKGILNDFASTVQKIKGFRDALAANKEGAVIKRFKLQEQLRSVINGTILDADGEDMVKQSTSVDGLPELINTFAMWVSAMAGIPMTLLFGLSPGGFGTGQAEGDNWDDTVKAYQQEDIEPMLEYVYSLLFLTPDFNDVPEGWQIEFAPLQLTNPIEEADLRHKQMQTDVGYITSAVVSPNDITQSRFGGAKYSVETTVSQESIAATKAMDGTVAEANRLNEEMMNQDPALLEQRNGAPIHGQQNGEPAESTVEPSKTAMSAGQISAMQNIAKDVVAGEYPIETAVGIMVAAFPDMDQEVIKAILEPTRQLAQDKEAQREIARQNAPIPPTPLGTLDPASQAPQTGFKPKKGANGDDDDTDDNQDVA